jgi:hypothetical protein
VSDVYAEIMPWECPICKRRIFKDLQDMQKHIDLHNAKDPEIEFSVVAEREKFLERMF